MAENADDKDTFIQALLEERDRMFQEMQRLKGKLQGHTDVEQVKASYEKTIDTQQIKISKLEQQVAYLQRRLWGKSSEKFIKEDPLQRRLDFEGLELLPQEEELAHKAEQEIIAYKNIQVKIKDKPVRKPLPQDLPRVEEHIYPLNVDIHSQGITEL